MDNEGKIKNLLNECHHPECADSRWLRYCPVEAADADGVAGKTVKNLDKILYGTPKFDKGGFYYRGDHDGKMFYRTFHHEYMPADTVSLIGYQQRTVVSHEQKSHPTCDVYHVITEWYIPDEDRIDGVYRHEYALECYSEQIVATVTEYDLSVEVMENTAERDTPSFVDRPMTGYDHSQLEKLINDIHSLEYAQAHET